MEALHPATNCLQQTTVTNNQQQPLLCSILQLNRTLPPPPPAHPRVAPLFSLPPVYYLNAISSVGCDLCDSTRRGRLLQIAAEMQNE